MKQDVQKLLKYGDWGRIKIFESTYSYLKIVSEHIDFTSQVHSE